MRQFQKLRGVKTLAVYVEGWPQMKLPHFNMYQRLKLTVEAARPTLETETINPAVFRSDWAALPDTVSTLETDRTKHRMTPWVQGEPEMLIG